MTYTTAPRRSSSTSRSASCRLEVEVREEALPEQRRRAPEARRHRRVRIHRRGRARDRPDRAGPDRRSSGASPRPRAEVTTRLRRARPATRLTPRGLAETRPDDRTSRWDRASRALAARVVAPGRRSRPRATAADFVAREADDGAAGRRRAPGLAPRPRRASATRRRRSSTPTRAPARAGRHRLPGSGARALREVGAHSSRPRRTCRAAFAARARTW